MRAVLLIALLALPAAATNVARATLSLLFLACVPPHILPSTADAGIRAAVVLVVADRRPHRGECGACLIAAQDLCILCL